MARRQETRPQCLRPHPRGVRGKTEGADHRDENRTRGAEAAEGGRYTSATGSGGEEGAEENEGEQVKNSPTWVLSHWHSCR